MGVIACMNIFRSEDCHPAAFLVYRVTDGSGSTGDLSAQQTADQTEHLSTFLFI